MTISSSGTIDAETFAQANPFLTGWEQGQQITSQDIANRVAGSVAPYAGPTAAVDLATKQAMLPYIGMQQIGQYYGGLGRYLAGAPMYKLIGMGQNPDFQAAMANNPQLASEYSNAVNMAGALGGGMGMFPGMQGMPPGMQSSSMPQPQSQSMPNSNIANNSNIPIPRNLQQAQQMGYDISKIMPNIPQPQTPQSAQDQQYFQQAAMNGNPPTQQQNSPYIPVPNPYENDAQTQAIITQNAQNLISKNISPAQQQQITYTVSADKQLRQIENSIPAVASYSGIKGHAQLLEDKANAAAGRPTSPNYQPYLNYMAATHGISTDIRRAFGEHGTNALVENAADLINPISLTETPAQSLGKLQQVIDSFHQNTKAITQPIANLYSQAVNTPTQQLPGAPQNQAQRITVMSPTGQRGTISASNLQAALKAGYKQVGG